MATHPIGGPAAPVTVPLTRGPTGPVHCNCYRPTDADEAPANLFFLAAADRQLIATDDAAWNRAFAEWLRLDALCRADAAFGAYARANYENDWECYRIDQRHGKSSRSDQAAAERSRQYAVMKAAEDERYESFILQVWKAAADLACIAAPNLAAALFKIELVKREELDNFTDM